jgi:ketosteroid isomerase-like protein
MSDSAREELEAAEQAFNAAMISNDPATIRKCITDDWVLVTPENGPISAAKLLNFIATSGLTHDTMTKTTHHMQIMGDVATVTGRGQNTGWFNGTPIVADEWITDVYRKINGEWRCTLTHLTPALGGSDVRTTA